MDNEKKSNWKILIGLNDNVLTVDVMGNVSSKEMAVALGSTLAKQLFANKEEAEKYSYLDLFAKAFLKVIDVAM